MAPPIKSEQEGCLPAPVLVPEIEKVFERDPYLKPHETEIRRR